MLRAWTVSALLILGLFQRSSLGQPPGPVQSGEHTQLQHDVTVALKLVQVYVTDKKGIPITDLQKDEFILYDNKDRKIITEFERHALSLPGAAVRAPTGEVTEPAPDPQAPLLNRKFFLLFDLVFTEHKGFRIAREAALQFVNSGLMPADEASVLLFAGGRSLEARRLPTSDHDDVRKAVESLSIADLLNGVFTDEETSGPSILRSGQDASFSNIKVSPSGGASETRIMAANFIWAMKSFAQALRSQPGQKHVVLYSKGLAPALIGRGEAGGAYSELNRGYADMCRELAAAGVSVFPVNTAEPRPRPDIGTGASTLRETAASTGGRFLGFAVNAEKHMEMLNSITGMYYVLGFPVGQTWDGKFHSVRIKVARPDCEVHAQPGYFNPKPFADYSKIEKEIHLVDLALSSKPLSQEPARFAMQAVPLACSPNGNLLFITKIPRGAGGLEGPGIEVASLVFNAFDEIVDSQRVKMELPAGGPGRERTYLMTSLSARPGTYKCRVVLRDPETGRAAVAGVPAIVPASPADELVLLPPLLAAEDADSLLLSGNTEDQGRPVDRRAAQAFFLDPGKLAPYLGNELTAGASIRASIRCVTPHSDISGLELSARLNERGPGDGRDVRLLILEKRAEESIAVFSAEIDVPQVVPGVYDLCLTVRDKKSGRSSRVIRSYQVKEDGYTY